MLLLSDSAASPTTAPALPGPQHVAPAGDAGFALAGACRAQRVRV
ncbi:MAG: hypothetical protein P8R54_33755 [Myxococcota bacterium]|nr:hypothetical protein [Myxococcota bacterium]